jgi:hypothetical protein
MAFRIYAFRYPEISERDGAAELPCLFVGETDLPDVVFFWVNLDSITEAMGERGVAWIAGWIGAMAVQPVPVWIGMPPRYKDGLIAEDFANWRNVTMAFNGDPVDALATLLRKRFIGMPYADYLQTPHWQEVREAALKAADYRCQVCYSPEKVHVHHRTYDRRGHELPSDVTVLCADCHGRFHDKLPKE